MFCELLYYKKCILCNDEIQELLKLGNHTDHEFMLVDIKKKLLEFDEYREYMKRYHDIMYMVMEINTRYRKIIGKGSCCL